MLRKISAKAPQPYLNASIAPDFEALRQEVYQASGVDFLSVLGDVFRDATLKSRKDGVAYRSNHKTGRAFDYNQASPHILIVTERKGRETYFRTYIKCAKQDGSQGFMPKSPIRDKRGFNFGGYVIDFTAMAAKYGFYRIPAWGGWQYRYNRQEFWHYEKMEGLTWDEAMRQVKIKPNVPTNPKVKIYGINDKGIEVQKIQQRLIFYKYLAPSGADGIFGVKTREAVVAFQRNNGLDPDGLVGEKTRAKLFA